MKVNLKATIGSLDNPYPAGTEGGAVGFANKHYFKKGVNPENYNADQVGTFTAEGKRKGRGEGTSNSGYVLDSSLFKTPGAPSPWKTPAGLPLEQEGAKRREWSAKQGLVLLASLAPALTVELGATPEQKSQRRMTGAEMKEAMKKAGIKPGSDEAFDWLADNNNISVTDIVPARPADKFALADLVKQGGKITLPPGQVAKIAGDVAQMVRDACRDFSSED